MSLKDALAGIKEAQSDPPPAIPQERPAVKRSARPAATPETQPARTTGKSSNPEFEPVKLYVRKQTRRAAERKWEDDTGGDFSELVEHLLSKYLKS